MAKIKATPLTEIFERNARYYGVFPTLFDIDHIQGALSDEELTEMIEVRGTMITSMLDAAVDLGALGFEERVRRGDVLCLATYAIEDSFGLTHTDRTCFDKHFARNYRPRVSGELRSLSRRALLTLFRIRQHALMLIGEQIIELMSSTSTGKRLNRTARAYCSEVWNIVETLRKEEADIGVASTPSVDPIPVPDVTHALDVGSIH